MLATLDVYANPYHSLDHLGRPAGVCPRERQPTTLGHAGYVGATPATTEPTKRGRDDHRSPDQDTCWQFSKEKIRVEDTPYYRKAIRSGELLPASESTAKKVGGVEFLPHDAAIAKAKAEAFKAFEASIGVKAPDIDPFMPPRPGVHPDDYASSPASIPADSKEVA